jgi:hypothetical protein
MTEFGDQNDPNHEAGEAALHSFGWFAGAVVLAITLGVVVSADRVRTGAASTTSSTTSAMMSTVPLQGNPATSPGSTTSQPAMPHPL